MQFARAAPTERLSSAPACRRLVPLMKQALKVLIVEDNLMIADMAEEIIIQAGFIVCGIARTFDEAVKLCKSEKPDLALIDYKLSDNELGTDVAAELRTFSKLGILYATGNSSMVFQLDAVGEACLTKPYRVDDLGPALRIVDELVKSGTSKGPLPRVLQILRHYKSENTGHTT